MAGFYAVSADGASKDADAAQTRRFEAGESGGFTPVMYVDEQEDELSDFAALIEESCSMTDHWDIVFIGCLPGRNGLAPTREQGDKPLKTMIQTIHAGGDLSDLVSLDRDGSPVFLESLRV